MGPPALRCVEPVEELFKKFTARIFRKTLVKVWHGYSYNCIPIQIPASRITNHMVTRIAHQVGKVCKFSSMYYM